jgi:hypothetical protein
MIPLNAVTLTSETASVIDLNAQQAITPTQMVAPEQVTGILISNESPYALLVQYRDVSRWFLPWTEDLLPGGATLLRLTPSTVPGGSALPSQPQSKAALVTVFLDTDTIPDGNWPVALSRQVAIGNQLNTATQITETGVATLAGTNATLTTTLPAEPTAQMYLLSFLFTCSPLSVGQGTYRVDLISKRGAVVTDTLSLYFASDSTTAPMPLPLPFPLGIDPGESLTVTCVVPANSLIYTVNAIVLYI